MTCRVLRLNPLNPDLKVIEEIVNVVRGGGVIIYPTDTVYGLGGRIDREEVLERIALIKGRGKKPFPILASSAQKASELGVFNRRARLLVEEFWPGPLTIKVIAKVKLSNLLVDEEGKIALRVPDCIIAVKIAEGTGGFIVGTSANRTGSPSPLTLEEALREIGEKVDLAVDGGATTYRCPSTIIDVTVSPPVIVRVGAIAPEEIEEVLGEEVRVIKAR